MRESSSSRLNRIVFSIKINRGNILEILSENWFRNWSSPLAIEM